MSFSAKPLAAKLLGFALCAVVAAPAFAQHLAGAPEAGPEAMQAGPSGASPSYGGDPRTWSPHTRHARSHAGGRACYAQVRTPAAYAPPPSGPEYVWRQAPAPPGAPGPVWCLTVQPFPDQPVQVAPARLGWIRVLCADDATPERVSRLQRGLHARGLYRGEIDGRYDEQTADAVIAFQHERHIEHRGYLSYETLGALEAPPPPVYWRPRTAFERGYLEWPGKSHYW